jgi:hypothetical protein
MEPTGSVFVEAEGWERLILAPSKRHRFLEAVEAAGFVVHRHANQERVLVLPPGDEPDWRDP